MEDKRFIKFPRTPHLGIDSSVVDDDEVKDKEVYLKSIRGDYNVVVQEKVDGTNVSVHFEEAWVPVIQKRSGLLGRGEKKQYQMFTDFVNENLEELWNMLQTDYCLFGEWLWRKHSVKYTKLPSYFLAFDIFDKNKNEFICYKKFLSIIGDAVESVPLVWQGNVKDIGFKEAIGKESLQKCSIFGDERTEGVYIRFERGDKIIDRVKIRRADVKGLEVFAEHNIENNKV